MSQDLFGGVRAIEGDRPLEEGAGQGHIIR